MNYLDDTVIVSRKFLYGLEKQYNIEKDEYEFLIQKIKINWEYYLSAKAEFENYKKLNKKNLDILEQRRLVIFIKDFLIALDSFESGINSMENISKENYESFKDGFLLTYNLIYDLLKKNNIVVLDPVGCDFDPVKHEAIAVTPGPDFLVNKVVKVMQKGFVCFDVVIRVARVIVGGKNII